MAADGVRIDKWLWAARMFKHRTAATEACQAGHVKVNGDTAKPAKTVRIGDRIEARTPGGEKVLVALALAEKRGPAAVAQALYRDETPPPPPEDPWEAVERRARGAGRPTKRDRRRIDRFRD